MTIDWCEEHRCSSPSGRHRCEWAWARLNHPRLPTPCLIVPMRLVSDNTETVERIVEALSVRPARALPREIADLILAALEED